MPKRFAKNSNPFRPEPQTLDSTNVIRKFSVLSIYALTLCVSDDLENLRRVIRFIEEMDAYFSKLESSP